MFVSTFCIMADVHIDDVKSRLVDRADGHEVSEPIRVTNNLPGPQAVTTVVAELASRLGYPRIEIAWEVTGMLWIPSHRYLSHGPQLQPFDLQFVCFSTQLVSKSKDGLIVIVDLVFCRKVLDLNPVTSRPRHLLSLRLKPRMAMHLA